MLGYYSYTIVNKNRYTYQLKDNEYTYSIMVDNIEDLGGFVEFEIVCENKIVDEDVLRSKLNQFVSLFSSLNLEEAKLPYRDFVAIKKYNDILPSKSIKGIHINLDEFLKSYEKDFYCYYKLVMKKEFNFTGDGNVLLSGNEYTKESKYARSVRDAMDNCRIKGNRIQELEEKINLMKLNLLYLMKRIIQLLILHTSILSRLS